jgi:lysophospholipase L1-like esterase
MHSLLCLGDSYTIGEGVPLYDSFPYQTLQLLRHSGQPFYAPEIIARTGWTTDELIASMSHRVLLPQYDFVTLLIGVNNQYRGRDTYDYAAQFEQLLQQATKLAIRPEHVVVLSIPDWGLSPFAAGSGRDQALIGREIDHFNRIAGDSTRRSHLTFIDITTHGRTAGPSANNFTADGLHPSAAHYHFWAGQLVAHILQQLEPASRVLPG